MTYSIRGGSAAITPRVEAVATRVLAPAMGVHRALGPGLYESIYEFCLARSIEKCGLEVHRQVLLPVVFEGETLDAAFRADLVVAGCVMVEVKAVQTLLPVHRAQLLFYLRLSGIRLGLLINFHEPLLRDGLKRLVL